VGGVAAQAAHDRHFDGAGGGEGEQGAAEGGGVCRQGGRGGEGGGGSGARVFFDVGDVEFVQDAEPGAALGGGAEVFQDAGGAFGDAGWTGADGADHAERESGAVVAVVGAFQQSPGGEFGGEPVGGGDGKPGQPGDLGEGVFAALGEGQQDRGDLAGHRSSGFGGVAGHGILLAVCSR